MSGVQGSGVLRALPSLIDEGGGGNPDGCSDDVCGITDTFARPDDSGVNSWGIADAGLVWDNTSGGITSGRAWTESTSTLKSGSLQYLDNPTTQVVTGQMVMSGVSTPANAIAEVFFGNLSFGAFVDFKGDGAVEVLDQGGASATFSPGFLPTTAFKVRMTVAGSTLSVTVWDAVSAEPAPQSVIAIGPSFTATRNLSFLGAVGNGSGGTVRVYWDDLDIEGVNRCTATVQFDDFDRVVAGLGWGSSGTGITWFIGGPGGVTDISVSGGYGKLTQGSGFTGGQKYMWTTDGVEKWGGDFALTARFKILSASASSQADQYLEMVGGVDQFGVAITKNHASVDGADRLSLFWSGSSTVFTATSWSVGVLYEVKFQRVGTTLNAKTWLTGTAEPAGWDVMMTAGSAISPTEFRVFSQRNSSSALTWSVWWDFIDFDYDERPCMLDCTLPSSSYSEQIPSQSYGWTRQADGFTAGPTQSSAVGHEDSALISGNPHHQRVFKTFNFGGIGPDGVAARYYLHPMTVSTGKRDGSTLGAGIEVTYEIVASSTGWDFDTIPLTMDPGGTVVHSGTFVSSGSPPSMFQDTPAIFFVGVLPNLNLYVRQTNGPVFDADGRRVNFTIPNVALVGGVCTPVAPVDDLPPVDGETGARGVPGKLLGSGNPAL